jgi:predicted glycosyltransferase
MIAAAKARQKHRELSLPKVRGESRPPEAARGTKIWIDLDNTPHVPFFAPIIQELHRRGYSVVLTARAAFQVCELADLYHLDYKRIGRHYGKNKLMKAVGLCIRTLQVLPVVAHERPVLAVSHGSRSQLLAAAMLGIPSVLLQDYEFARLLLGPTWIMMPEVVGDSAAGFPAGRVLEYPGIKEDVYVPGFVPNPLIRAELGLNEGEIVATVRPPANEAHYHNPESGRLFDAVMQVVSERCDTRIVALPRNERQAAWLRTAWPNLFSARKIVVPQHAVDGLSLIWYSDLVISGGGTMNREAAALGVPVYSIFRGRLGAVDRYLAEKGRLVLLESIDDVRSKIVLQRRQRPMAPQIRESAVLQKIVDDIVRMIKAPAPRVQPAAT